jgi:hypothetical protein
MSRVGFIGFGDSGREGGNKTRQREEGRKSERGLRPLHNLFIPFIKFPIQSPCEQAKSPRPILIHVFF